VNIAFWFGKPEGNRQRGRPRRKWEDNINMDINDIVCVGMDWVNKAQDSNKL
jgi:hypothetical protein